MLKQAARRRISWIAGAALSTVFLSIAGTSQAASYALVEVRHFYDGASNINGGVPLRDYPQGTGSGVVTVGTGPTPSLMWGEGALISEYGTVMLGGTVMFSPGGVITQSSPSAYGLYFNFTGTTGDKNYPGSLQKSHAAATQSTMWPATTTICANECAPRDGTLWNTPGAKRYGGTARLIGYGVVSGLRKNFTVGGFTEQYFGGTRSPALTGDQIMGNYGHLNTIDVVTPLGAVYRTDAYRMEGSLSTGLARAKLDDGVNAYTTDLTKAGSFDLNTANMTGTISLVQPSVDQGYSKVNGVVVGKPPSVQSAGIYHQKLTFLPEPGQLLLLGVGVLGLTALYGRRR